jgi:hypothetical protein
VGLLGSDDTVVQSEKSIDHRRWTDAAALLVPPGARGRGYRGSAHRPVEKQPQRPRNREVLASPSPPAHTPKEAHPWP